MKIKSTKATKNLTMALSTSHINFDNVTELKSGVIGTLSNKPLNAVVKRKYTKRRPISTSEWRCETAGIGLHTLELYCRADQVKDVGWEGVVGYSAQIVLYYHSSKLSTLHHKIFTYVINQKY